MAWTSNGTSTEFAAGHTPLTNTGRSNENALTLADAGNGTDQGLHATSGRWSSMTPRGVLQTALGGSQDDGSWQRMRRNTGGYQPGSFEGLSDQLSSGTNDNID